MKAEYGDLKQILVQLKDGSTWTAEIDPIGNVNLLKMLSSPDKKLSEPEPKPASKPEPSEADSEESDESEDAEPEDAEPREGESDGKAAPQTGEYENSSLDDYINDLSHRDLKGAETEDNTDPMTGEVYAMPDKMMANLKDPAFRSRLSSVMLDNKYDRRTKGRTRGKLDMSKLYKVPTGSRSVFMQKESRKGKEYNIVLLVDESGSMGVNNKSWRAAEAAVFLASTFEGLNVNVAIIGFNGIITVRKEFTKPANYAAIYNRIGSMNHHDGASSNNDWDALNRGYRMFDTAPKGQNILIMLSDGEPASTSYAHYRDINGKKEEPPKGHDVLTSGDKDSRVHLHHLVKANDSITSIGIGITEGGWQIPDHEVVHDVNDLKKTIVKQLKRHIQRG